MKSNIKNVPSFIEKYFEKLIWEKAKLVFIWNIIEISVLGNVFWINILDKFYFDSRLEKVNDFNLREFAVKLLDILNDHFYIPMDIKLNSISIELSQKSIFLISITSLEEDLSEELISIIWKSELIYTNNPEFFKNNEKLKTNWKIFNINEINNLENYYDVTVVYYWDRFNEIITQNILYKKFSDSNFYILPCSSNFINHFSLSVANYWSLFFSWSYMEINSFYDKIQFDFNKFLECSEQFSIKNYRNSMINKTTFSILLSNFQSLNEFIDLIKKENLWKITDYFINIIFETKTGYFNLFKNLSSIDTGILKHETNVINISVFIFKNLNKNKDFFKFNSLSSPKTFTFLSAPLGKTKEFNFKTIDCLIKSKYIFWETLDWTRDIFNRLNITYNDKELYYWDDLNLIDNVNFNNEDWNFIDKIPDVLPDLYKLLILWQKIVFLTDWWVPCILDPWDYIKKYIINNFDDYSVLWFIWPSVLPTVLLWSCFDYKNIFWTPLIYAIYPVVDEIKESNFFSYSNFKDTLIIFYSFWENIIRDLETLNAIFDCEISLQIIWDISTNREYNKIFMNLNIDKTAVDYIASNIKNLVYLIKLNDK